MAIKTVSCPTCDYPLKEPASNRQTEVCAYCGEKLEAVNVPISGGGSTFVAGLVGFGLGVFLGPAFISASKGGRRWLEEQARKG